MVNMDLQAKLQQRLETKQKLEQMHCQVVAQIDLLKELIAAEQQDKEETNG